MRRWLCFLVVWLAILSFSSTARATWSVIAVDQKTRRVAIASATCVPQGRFAGFPAKGLRVVPGKGVAAAQAAVDRTRKNQELVFREISKGTPPAAILEYESWKRGATPVIGLTLDSLMAIRFPSRAVWSPSAEHIAFIWDHGGRQNVWVVGAASGPPRALTSYPEGPIDALFWSADGRLLYFARDGDLWQVPLEGGEPSAVWKTAEGEGDFALSPDGGRVAFVRSGDLLARSLADGRETRLTATETGEYGPVWSPDGARLAFSFSSTTPQQDVFDYVGAKVAFRRFQRALPDVGVVPAAGGPSAVMAASPGAESTPRWVDGSRLSLQRVSADYRTREVLLADAAGGEPRLLHRDFDEKWWSIDYLGPEPTPSPDGRWVAFLSDRDGWDHLYVVPTAGGALHQITRGDFEVGRPAWSPDGKRIAFDTNKQILANGTWRWRRLALTPLARGLCA